MKQALTAGQTEAVAWGLLTLVSLAIAWVVRMVIVADPDTWIAVTAAFVLGGGFVIIGLFLGFLIILARAEQE